MATQLVPTMRVAVDQNPRGSATAHVTMPSSNPFEREELSVRRANQPNASIPGVGMEGMGDFWSDLRDTALQIGAGAASNWLGIPQQQPVQSAPPAQAIPTQPAPPMQYPVPTPVPTSPPAQSVPTMNPNQYGQDRGGGMAQYLPWIIGGVAVLGVGGILLMRRKKK